MKFEDHCLITKLIFKEPYEDVHRWIDAMYSKYHGWEHWRERHHLEAIQHKYKNDETRFLVAYVHILCDWLSHLKEIAVPNDEKEVMSRLESKGLIF